MKKNKMMRIASVLLVAVLVSTCAISGTFAKYVTHNEGGDVARVAKWGVVIVAGGDLFGDYYDSTNHTPTAVSTASALSVQNITDIATIDLVAPGTKSTDGLTLEVTGTPEVRTKVDITVSAQDIYLTKGEYATMRKKPVSASGFAAALADGLYIKDTDGNYVQLDKDDSAVVYTTGTIYYELSDDNVTLSEDYYPVVYTNANTNAPATDGKITAVATAIAGLLGCTTDEDDTTAAVKYTDATKMSKTFDPNTDLSTALKLGNNKITWEWAFSVNDKADTVLGNLMAKAIDSAFTTDVVWIDTDSTTGLKTGTPLAIDSSSFIVTYNDGSNDVEVGSLKTSITIGVTATQVD